MKLSWSILASLAVLSTFPVLAMPTVSISDVTVAPGKVALVEVRVNNEVKNLAGAIITLRLPSSPTLQVSGNVQPGDLLPGALIQTNQPRPTEFRVAIVSSTGKNGPGILFRVPLLIPSSVASGTTLEVKIQSAQLADANGRTISGVALVGGRIFVKAPTPPPPSGGGLVSLPEITAAPGQAVDLEVRVSGEVKNVAGALLVIEFGGEPALTLAGKPRPGDIPPGALLETNQVNPTTLRIAVVSASGKDGPGVLAVIPVQVPASASPGATYTLKLSAQLANPNGQDIAVSTGDGKITISFPGGGTAPEIFVEDAVGSPGDTVTIKIVGRNLPPSVGAKLDFFFSERTPASAPALTVDPGGVRAGGFFDNPLIATNLQGSQLTIGLVSTTLKQGDGVLVTIPVQVPSNVSSGVVYAFTLKGSLVDDTGRDLPVGFRGGTLGISGIPLGTVFVEETKGRAGQTVIVPIKAEESIKGVAGVELRVKLVSPADKPRASFDFSAIKEGNLLLQPLVAIEPDPSNSCCAFTAGMISAQEGQGPAVVLNLAVQIPSNAPVNTEYFVEITGAFNDARGQTVPVFFKNGKITVESAVLRGDLNGDGKVTTIDASLALFIAIGRRKATPEQMAAGDLNGDGKISVGEATRILRVAIKLEKEP